MKKILALVLCVIMVTTCFAACNKEETNDLANAVAYLENMYQTGSKTEPMNLGVDKDVLSVVTVDGVSYTVEWSVNVTEGTADSVKIAESATPNCVTIDVPDLTETDILFTAVATVKDAEGNTASAEFKFKVKGIELDDGSNDTDDTGNNTDDTGNNTDDTSNGTTTTTTGNKPTTTTTAGVTELKLVTDQAKILKDAFALGKNKTTPYIAQLTGKVMSIDKEYNEQYGSVTVTIMVGDKRIKCYNMKGTGTNLVKAGDTITVRGVIKNFYYDESDSSGTVEFTWDEASQTEVVMTKRVAGVVEDKKLSIVDNPVAGTAYKFGLEQTNKGETYYAVGGMSGYYMATSTSSSVAVDVYLENTTGGYYLYAMVDGKKQYMYMEVSGKYVNAKYGDTAKCVFTYDATLKTMVTEINDSTYAFGTYDNYVTIGTADIVKHPDNFFCHFYK
ncbi:MAG: hypothetical protein IJ465_08110 [Clostridia bacterium]|nr:hypothetical protein [Clostridia bacterium]